ncbi:MAG: DUF4398 domain-containing protein [bacterium]
MIITDIMRKQFIIKESYRMNLRPLFLVGVLGIWLTWGFVTGCSKPPDQEITQAEQAIQEAVQSGADGKSPKLMNMARAALEEAKTLADQGHYKDARNKALSAKRFAEMAEKHSSGGERRPTGKKSGEE